MTIFVIKIIACITMILDHVKYGVPFLNNFITNYFGRISFPLFAFLATEGYIHTSDLKKYYIRLIVFAIISQIPFMLFRTLVGEWKMLNAIFTLLFGLIAITIYDKEPKKCISLPLVLLIIFVGYLLKVDYGWFGVSVVFIMYLFKEKKGNLVIAYFSILILYFYSRKMLIFNLEVILKFISYLMPLIIINFYNGKLGRKLKYFYYAFYPIHMLIIYLISFMY